MAKRTRNVTMAAAAAVVLGIPSLSVAADELAPPVSSAHVRSTNPALAALIQQAGERSATFRGLVETIETSDSIVFVEAGHCGHAIRACFVDVTGSASHRYMRVFVDTSRADWDVMGSIGHELRHTIEVIEVPHIRDNASKKLFYQQIGTYGTPFARETQVAVDAGNTVRAEVRRFQHQQAH